jgi:hypothetical protein
MGTGVVRRMGNAPQWIYEGERIFAMSTFWMSRSLSSVIDF